MADKYFFGRTPFNNGGIARLNFANGTPGFYSAKDQAIYDAGDKFMPQSKYLQNDYIPTEGISYEGDGSPVSYANSGIISQAPIPGPLKYTPEGGGGGDDDDDDTTTTTTGNLGLGTFANVLGFMTNPIGFLAGKLAKKGYENYKNPYKDITGNLNQETRDAIGRDTASTEGRGQAAEGSGYDAGNECFEPNTLIQMANGSKKKIKDIQLGDSTRGGEVTGVFKFKPSGNGIYNYKNVTVAGSHFVKEDGKFIMVKDSPLSVKIDKIPVVYSLDTTGRRIFINDIEFADYNGDGVAKSFLTNAGVDLTGFDKEVLRQVEHRLI